MIVATGFPSAEDAALTLQQARALALTRSATLRGAALAVDAASLAAQAQGYAALPSISASAGGSYGYELDATRSASPWSGSAKIAATQTLFDGGRTSELVKKYGFATEAARESLRSTRISLLGQVDAAFFAVLGARASVDAATSDLDSAKLRQTIAQAKIDAGSLSKSAYLQTQADTAGYETSLLLAKKALDSAKAKLASLTGRSAATALEPVDFSAYDGLLAKLSALDGAAIDRLAADIVAIAKANSPALSGYALSIRQASSGVAIAKAAFAPTVAAGFSQGLSLAQDPITGKLGQTYPGSVSLTASMSLDLWNTKNALASAEVASAEASLSAGQGETDLELGVVQALYEWISSAASIGSAAKALDYAQSNYDNVLERFKLSSATTSDLSAAEALVSTDRTALIAARYGFLSNLSTLGGLAGLEDATKLTEAVH
jgi:adhesin transport system outer membrane protein